MSGADTSIQIRLTRTNSQLGSATLLRSPRPLRSSNDMVGAIVDAVIATEMARTEADVEVFYTLPGIHETPDDRVYFRRLEALGLFATVPPAGNA